MSLVADAIRLSVAEKELHNLNYPFRTIPAMKIAKLAVSQSFRQIYRGIGSFMIQAAHRIARKCSNDYFAVRFLTVDADIEHDKNVLSFYKKNGFIFNNELQNKNRKTISMRLDLY
jgi:tRNA(Met) C34 N-acetyltransferase TmcA